jgi:hypothetical protein
MINSRNILTYHDINILVLKLIILTLPMGGGVSPCLLHNLSVNDIGASIFKISCSVPIYYVSRKKKVQFFYSVYYFTVCRLPSLCNYKQFDVLAVFYEVSFRYIAIYIFKTSLNRYYVSSVCVYFP